MKKNYFALLHCLFVSSIKDYKAGGFGRILEVDEALRDLNMKFKVDQLPFIYKSSIKKQKERKREREALAFSLFLTPPDLISLIFKKINTISPY